jgi:membrane-associated protease RseP (regulator of RpoE activity)
MMKHASLLMIAALFGGVAVASAQEVEIETNDGGDVPHRILLNGNMGGLAFNCGGSFLGIVGDEVNDEIVQKLNLPGEYGAIINEVVKESSAEKAGLQKEDVIVGYNGTRVESMAQLRRMIAETPVGRTVDLTIIRNGSEQRIKAELGTRSMPEMGGLHLWNGDGENMLKLPEDLKLQWNEMYETLPPDFDERMKEQMEKLEERLKEFDGMEFSDSDVRFYTAPEGNAFWLGMENNTDTDASDNPAQPRVFTRMLLSDGRRLGATVQGLSPQLARFFKLQDGESGALVSEVHSGQAAEKGGLQAGDVITAVDGEAVKTPMDLTRIISKKEGTVELRVIRDGSEKTFQIDLGKKDQGFNWQQEGPRDLFKMPDGDVDLSLYGR